MNLTLQPKVLRWARDRAGLDTADLAGKLKVDEGEIKAWEAEGSISFARMEKLAQVTHTPVGYFFLHEPPEDRLPIPDFRTLKDAPLCRPSPDLLETVYLMQRRQTWMREFLLEEGEPALPFIGTAALSDTAESVATAVRSTLGFSKDWAQHQATWTDALVHLRQRLEAEGILIVVNGIVGNDTHRPLNPEEFRGFTLCDAYAPLIFINGADAKAAQMFTLAHELAHLWIGQEGVSNPELSIPQTSKVEQFCNAVAAEFLVPALELQQCWAAARRADEPYQFVARRFKVSPLVAARRALDLHLETRDGFLAFYRAYELDERRKQERSPRGGNFWNTQNVRIGTRFGAAVVRAAKEGRLPYRQAYELTGLKGPTFDRFAEKLGIRLQ